MATQVRFNDRAAVAGIKAKWPCPECTGVTRVYDSRGIHRWRECLACGVRFLTVEQFARRIRKHRNRKPRHLGLSRSA